MKDAQRIGLLKSAREFFSFPIDMDIMAELVAVLKRTAVDAQSLAAAERAFEFYYLASTGKRVRAADEKRRKAKKPNVIEGKKNRVLIHRNAETVRANGKPERNVALHLFENNLANGLSLSRVRAILRQKPPYRYAAYVPDSTGHWQEKNTSIFRRIEFST